MLMNIIKKIVYAICILYTINVFITPSNKCLPINAYTIMIVTVFGIFGVFLIVYLKFYL